MKYAVDKIEDDLVVCEELTTGEKITLNKNEIKGDVHEGTIIIKSDSSYEVNNQEEENRRKLLQKIFNKKTHWKRVFNMLLLTWKNRKD